jgi:deoxyribodipyrimidine photo-lyase
MCWTRRASGCGRSAARHDGWLAQSLRALQTSLQAAGTALVLRRGPAGKIIPELAREAGAGCVYWNEVAQAPHQAVAKEVEAALARHGVNSKSLPGDLLVSPREIRNKDGRSLRVFTPFWRRVLALGDPPAPLPAPKSLRPAGPISGDTIENLGLEPRQPDWAGGLRETWRTGEKAAQTRLKDFLGLGVEGYARDRDRPDRCGTSSLSPHLRFGEISPRQIWHAARFAAAERPALAGDIEQPGAAGREVRP